MPSTHTMSPSAHESAGTGSTRAGHQEPPHEPPQAVGTGGPQFGASALFTLDQPLPARPLAFRKDELSFDHLGGAIDPAPGTDSFIGYVIKLAGTRPLPINTELHFFEPGDPATPSLSGALIDDLILTRGSRALVLVCEDSRIIQLDSDLTMLRGIDMDTLPVASLTEIKEPRARRAAPELVSAGLTQSGSVATAERSVASGEVEKVSRGLAALAFIRPAASAKTSDEDLIDIAAMARAVTAAADVDPALALPASVISTATKGILGVIQTLKRAPLRPEPTRLQRVAHETLVQQVGMHIDAINNIGGAVLSHMKGEISLVE